MEGTDLAQEQPWEIEDKISATQVKSNYAQKICGQLKDLSPFFQRSPTVTASYSSTLHYGSSHKEQRGDRRSDATS